MPMRALTGKVGDLRQLASVRMIVLDEGPEAGVRALLFSTGGGLDFMVLADRTLDIGTVHYRGVPLAWQSPAGFRHPALGDSLSDGGRGFGRLFSGFLMTCGLDHIRQPRDGAPLHGRLPSTPARLLSRGEDWSGDRPTLFCEAEIIQASHGREAFRLLRRIESPIGGTSLSIVDRVENCGTTAWPQAMLYHFNLGYPAIADGSCVAVDGMQLGGPVLLDDPRAAPDVVCVAVRQGPFATCTVTTPSEAGPLEVALRFSSPTLPYLQVWRDLRPRAGVLAIEPCTSDRFADGTSDVERALEPGEQRVYSVEVQFSGHPAQLLSDPHT
jgi:hypothetical protein